jgi:uncharacterized protein YcnI
MSIRRSTLARPVGVVMIAAVLTLATGAAAQAHVQVIPDQTAAGSEITKLTFRVPTESEKASTVSVAISLPTDTPLAEVLAEPIAGWSVTVKEGQLPKPVDLDGTTLTEAPSTVTWTAARGQGVPPGGFQEFALSAGPIPDDAKVLSFPTVQTYSDGSVVTWNQPQPAGADEPEFPLPSFDVTAAQPEDAGTSSSVTAAAPVAKASDSTDSLARGLGIGGLVVGVLGLAFAVVTWRKAGSRA